MRLFICGNSRSGTTMMSRILGNHAEVYPFQELHFFDELVSDPEQVVTKAAAIKLYATLCSIQQYGYFGKREPDDFISEAASAFEGGGSVTGMQLLAKFLDAKTFAAGKSIPCEQTPQNIFNATKLLESLPESKIIIMVRDPRAVLLSQKNKWQRRKYSGGNIPFREAVRARINYHPSTISRLWNSVMKETLKIKNQANVFIIRYEDLVTQPETTVRKLCSGLGISFDNQMLQIPVTGSSNSGDVPSKTGIAIDKVQQWENSELSAAEIGICQDINNTIMEQFNYPVIAVKNTRLLKLGYSVTLPFKLILATLVNMKRWRYYLQRVFNK